jgi:hypothetical protein
LSLVTSERLRRGFRILSRLNKACQPTVPSYQERASARIQEKAIKTSLVTRIVCFAAAIVVTVDGVTAVLTDYALPRALAAPLAAASLGAAHLATCN